MSAELRGQSLVVSFVSRRNHSITAERNPSIDRPPVHLQSPRGEMHQITCASERIVCGIVRPSAFAVFALTTKSNVVD
jgi:hypothetical protein